MWRSTVFQLFLPRGIRESRYILRTVLFYIITLYDLLFCILFDSWLSFVYLRRISITFRKMDETKWPVGYTPEPDLQGLQPLSYEADRSKHSNISKINHAGNLKAARSVDNSDRLKERGFFGPGPRRGRVNRQRLRLDMMEG